MNTPLVTCLCLTMPGRSGFLEQSVQCFLKQTYPYETELLIVADRVEDVRNISCGDCVGMTLPHKTRFSCLVGEWKTIGSKRNEGIAMATGDVIAIFDDDDYSAPGRISQQVAELERTGAAVTGYQSMKFTDGSAWWNFNCAPGFVIGSSLCFRRDWWLDHPFPEVQIGEDAAFCSVAHQAGKLAACPDLGLMYATIHAGNTSKRDLSKAPWEALPGFEWKDRHKGVWGAWRKANQ